MSVPLVLTIAGFDCSAGAGLQADLKTFTALGTYGLTAATCIVAETPNEVTRIDAVDPAMLEEQIRLLLSSYEVSAIKTGMLYDTPQIEVVARLLTGLDIPLIVDPVMLASTGDSLLRNEALEVFCDSILPLARVITPNRAEAEFLFGEALSATLTAEDIAAALAARFGCTCVLKGGHLDHSQGAVDLVADENGLTYLRADWVDIPSGHGTGCTFAAAMAAAMGKGQTITEAAAVAKEFVTHALERAHRWTGKDGRDIIALDQSGI